MTSRVTAADYSWIRSPASLFGYALDVGYTLTLVRGVAPAELFRRAGAEPAGTRRGMRELITAHGEFTEPFDPWPESFLAAAATVPGEGGDWTLALDFGGDLGTRPRVMTALSAGTRAVSHTGNGGKPLHFFHWYENRESRTTFESPSAMFRTGATPDELNPLLREVGLDPEGDTPPGVDHKAAAFALAERLTGVRVTHDLLHNAEFALAEIPEEPPEEWTSVTVDITDAHGHRTHVTVRRDHLPDDPPRDQKPR